MFPGLEQHFLVVDADLHVPELEIHEVADEVHEVGGALFAADHLRIELQVEQAGAAVGVHAAGAVGDGHHGAQRTVDVGALRGRNAFGKEGVRVTTVRGGPGLVSEADVGGDGHVFDVLFAEHGFVTVDDGHDHGVEVAGDVVGIGIVVAVLGRVEHQLTERFLTFKIVVHGVEQLVEGEHLVVVHELFDGAERFRAGAEAVEVDVAGVVMVAAGDEALMDVHQVLHAYVALGGHEGRGEALLVGQFQS